MKETLLVKHAVGGRTFIDTGKEAVAYELEPAGEGFRFRITGLQGALVEEIMKWKDELNVFLFQDEPGQPTKKIWFYVKDGPVTYDAASSQVTIIAKSRIEYIPDHFSAQL